MLQTPRNLRDILVAAEVNLDSATRNVNECFDALDRARKYAEEAKRRVNYWKRLIDLEANSNMMVGKEPDVETTLDPTPFN